MTEPPTFRSGKALFPVKPILPRRWTLETFPFARQPGVNREQIRGFAELEFIAKLELCLAPPADRWSLDLFFSGP
jgi:hypothetical protein